MTDLDEQSQPTVAGFCHCCGGWTKAGRPAGDDGGGSGGGKTAVRCAACVAAPRPRLRLPTDPRTYPL